MFMVPIELPKVREIIKKEPKNKLAQWVMFLNNPNEREVTQIMEENEEIKEAMEELEELRRIAELKEKAIRDEQNGLFHARQDGIKEGINQEKREIAKKLKEKKLKIEEIVEITGLTKEEVKQIMDNHE